MTTSLQKIQKVSRLGSSIITALLVGIPFFYSAKWILIDHPIIKRLSMLGFCFGIRCSAGLFKPWMITWSPSLKILGLSSALINHLPLWLSLLALKQILKNYQQGIIFTDKNVRYYQYIGWLFLINAILIKPLSDILRVLLVTMNNPTGHSIFSIGCFGMANIEDFLWGSFVMVIAWVMLEANKIREEQDLTI